MFSLSNKGLSERCRVSDVPRCKWGLESDRAILDGNTALVEAPFRGVITDDWEGLIQELAARIVLVVVVIAKMRRITL